MHKVKTLNSSHLNEFKLGITMFFFQKSPIKTRKATIRPKRRFVPSDDSSQATIRPKFQKATIRPKRQFVPF